MYVQPSDITNLTGRDSDVAEVAGWVEKAEARLAAIVRSRGGDLAAIASDPSRLPLVCDIIQNAVIRVVRPPQSPDASPLDAAGNIWFPTVDLDLLWPVRRGVIGTLRVSVPSSIPSPRW